MLAAKVIGHADVEAGEGVAGTFLEVEPEELPIPLCLSCLTFRGRVVAGVEDVSAGSRVHSAVLID